LSTRIRQNRDSFSTGDGPRLSQIDATIATAAILAAGFSKRQDIAVSSDGAEQILSIFDQGCEGATFPMLDNGYFYLAATRMSLFRSEADWGLVVETFGFFPRARRAPETWIYTFASRLHDPNAPDRYSSPEAYDTYSANNPHNEHRFVFPVEEGSWRGKDEYYEQLAEGATEVVVRGRILSLPPIFDYPRFGIELEQPPRVQVFELCRYLAEVAREQVLATPQERRVSIHPDMHQLLQLEEWNHPDLASDAMASSSETFQQVAAVLASGDVSRYQPSQPSNTHWRNWPDGGRL
jgi:hypothetical protein